MLSLSSIFLFNFFYMYFATRPRPALTAVTLEIDDTLGDDVRGGDWGDGHGG